MKSTSIVPKTYIDPKLIPYTREFSDEEIEEWLKEDSPWPLSYKKQNGQDQIS